MAAIKTSRTVGSAGYTLARMDRLSKFMEREFGIEISHEELTRLGYRAEKRPNNPNTYYTIPGALRVIENTPRVIAYIRDHISTKQGALMLLGSAKVRIRASHRTT